MSSSISGFASGHGGKALPFREAPSVLFEAPFEKSEAQPRNQLPLSVRRSLTAMCCGKAAWQVHECSRIRSRGF